MYRYPARILAHRGGGTLAPENTLAGLKRGMQAGYRAIEFDVMLARDGVPVVMHDPWLGRTVPGSGNVYDYDACELAAMDAGGWFSHAGCGNFAGEPVPLFLEFAHYCKAHGVWMNIEIKPAAGFEDETGAMVARMTAALFADEIAGGRHDQVPLLSSFSAVALDAARDAAPQLPRAALMERLVPQWQERVRDHGAVALHLNHKYLTQAQAQAVKAAGLGLFCYTVNTPARARELFGWGVDAFCTDRIDLIAPDFS